MNSMLRWTTKLLLGCSGLLCAGTLTSSVLAQPWEPVKLPRPQGFDPNHRVPEPLRPLAPPIPFEELNQLIGGPTLVSLHLKDATPQAAFDELARQVKAA